MVACVRVLALRPIGQGVMVSCSIFSFSFRVALLFIFLVPEIVVGCGVVITDSAFPTALARPPCCGCDVLNFLAGPRRTEPVSTTGLGPGLQRPPEVVEVLGKAAVALVETLDEARLRRSFTN